LKRKLFSIIAIAFMLMSVSVANSATTLREIGRSPFCKPLKSPDDLVTMVQSRSAEMEKGFALAGRSDLYQPFMSQIGTAKIERVDYPKGTHFEWMFFKKKGKGAVRVAKDVNWASDKTFPGFQFDIVADGKRVTMVVPLGCGNVALMAESKMPAEKPVAKKNQAPTCGMVVTPTKAYCGDKVTVDARNSSDPDGKVAKMKISVVDKGGKVVSEKAVDGTVSDIDMPCGTNTVKVSVVDNDGAEATSAQCTAEVTGTKRVRLVGDVGLYRQFDPGGYLFGRVGGEYLFNEHWSIIGLVGGAWLFEGRDGASAFTADLFGEYKFASRFFIDLGVGGWVTDGNDKVTAEDDEFDLIASVGARVFGEPEGFNGSVFLEARSAFDELDELGKYGRFGIGMRFRF
jgi:hypothetical protein